jgi:hypothetical protein
MEIFTKNSAKCTIFQSNNCNNFSSLMNSISSPKLTTMTDVPKRWEFKELLVDILV